MKHVEYLSYLIIPLCQKGLMHVLLEMRAQSRLSSHELIAPAAEEAPQHSPGVYNIQGQRIFVVEKVRNVFVVGEAFSI